MKQFETLQQITSFILSRGSKASKIEALVNDGFARCDAESLYKHVMVTAPAVVKDGDIKFTVGVEIECYGVNIDRVAEILREHGIGYVDNRYFYNYHDSSENYKFMRDGSLNDGRDPVEVVSPVLKNLKSLSTVCDAINEAGATVNRTCGLHVHFGAEKLKDSDWQKVVVNYGNIEPIIDSFMAESRRKNNNDYCRSMTAIASRLEGGQWHYERDYLRRQLGSRYYKVNLEAYSRHRTIEFRQHGGTTNFEKIENWVKFLSAFLNWTIKHDEYLHASSIDELPFLTDAQKTYFKSRANALNRI